MPIPEKLLQEKAGILADTVDGLFAGVREIERKVVLKILPIVHALETKDGKLIASTGNYTRADVSLLVKASIDTQTHREFAKGIVDALRQARKLATEASKKMDKDFQEGSDAELIITEGAKAIVKNLSPEVLGTFIAVFITNRIIIAISLGQTPEELSKNLVEDVES